VVTIKYASGAGGSDANLWEIMTPTTTDEPSGFKSERMLSCAGPGQSARTEGANKNLMNIVKRGLLALSIVAVAGATAGGLLASQASASSTRGPETIRSTQYEVGDGVSVGPWTGHGVIKTAGNVTDAPSVTGDPDNSNREMLVDPNGSFTVLVTGGNQGPVHMNPNTCAVRFTVSGFDARIVTGTGVYRHATGDFKGNVNISGYASRLANGSCDTSQNGPTPLSTSSVVAVGHINLH
jgi:hypothetical protein